MIEDTVVKRPHKAKDKVYARKEGTCVGFLVPPGEECATLGPRLKKIGEAMMRGDSSNYHLTHDPAELHEYIYGPPETRSRSPPLSIETARSDDDDDDDPDYTDGEEDDDDNDDDDVDDYVDFYEDECNGEDDGGDGDGDGDGDDYDYDD